MVVLTYTRPNDEFQKCTVLGDPKSIFNLVHHLKTIQKQCGLIENLKITNLGSDFSIPFDLGFPKYLSYCERPCTFE